MKQSLEAAIGSSLHRADSKDWEIYSANLLGLGIALLESADYDDDRELKFTQYNYQISITYIRKLLENEYGSEWQMMAAKVIANMVSKKLNCECIAVKNMQELLGKFYSGQEIIEQNG